MICPSLVTESSCSQLQHSSLILSMSTSRRFLRLAPLAAVLVITSLVSACSSDLTGPSAKRSGYITTSAAVQALTTDIKTGTTTTSGGTTSTGTSTGIRKTTPADTSSVSSGYNVPAL